MIQQIYQEQDLPWKDLQHIGLFKNRSLNLDEDDLKAMLSGRRTEMLRLENLTAEGLHIPALDAKLSVKPNDQGVLELLVHPIYREAEVPQYLTDDEVNALERGEVVNVQKLVYDNKGDPKEILVEFDKDTNEFIITDTEKILAPDMVNSKYLSPEQKERYRKGKQVELPDGTRFQYSGTNSKGINANKLALVASILIDGGISYMLYQGLHALFGEKRDEEKASDYSKGHYAAMEDMNEQQGAGNIYKPGGTDIRDHAQFLRALMHPYLTRLGVRKEVQEFFAPFYQADANGGLVFSYGDGAESYGFAFHRVPVTNDLWIAGTENFQMVQQVIICSSAMEAISFLHYKYSSFPDLGRLLFIAVGAGICEAQLNRINSSLSEKKYTLVFGNDLLGKLLDLKIAAGIRKVPVAVYQLDGLYAVTFRHRHYCFKTAQFSLNAFEKQARYRFHIRTLKPKGFSTFFEQLKASAF